jgi:hypothetical protein
MPTVRGSRKTVIYNTHRQCIGPEVELSAPVALVRCTISGKLLLSGPTPGMGRELLRLTGTKKGPENRVLFVLLLQILYVKNPNTKYQVLVTKTKRNVQQPSY